MKFYINGNQVAAEYAFHRFKSYHINTGNDPECIQDIWQECLTSEFARDDYLPDNLEIVA